MSLSKELVVSLSQIASVELDYSLKKKSYLQTGGVALALVTIHRREDVAQVISSLVAGEVDYEVIGRGTNVIIKEGFIPKVIVQLHFDRHYNCYDALTEELELDASLPLIRANKVAHDHGLSGLEFFVGIPGSIGGAVVMNAGVKKYDVASVLSLATIFDGEKVVERRNNELGFVYRHSNIKPREIVLTARFKLKPVGEKEIVVLKKKCLDDLKKRKVAQPYNEPSVGSTFVNPMPNFAGALIEQCGLKGERVGEFQFLPSMRIFIVNDGSGTSDEAVALIKTIKEKVLLETKIELKEEVRYLGY